MKNPLIFLSLLLTINSSFSQEFTNVYGDYLGLKPPTDTPVVFAPDIVSTVNAEHSSIQFSQDGHLAVWCTIDANVKKIMQMIRVNNRWTTPVALDLFHDSLMIGNDAPCLTRNGKIIYFNSERETVKNPSDIESEWIKNSNDDLWFVEKTPNGWSQPIRLDNIINKGISELQISVANSGNIYFVSHLPGALNECGIFTSQQKDNSYTKPQALPLPIDKSFQNWTPFIAPDESYLIYSKCASNSDYGDLYISYYNRELNKWSHPQNIGEPINTWAQERFPYVSPDGKYLFFTRWTQANSHDIFWVETDFIGKLKSKAIYD
jgi:hypothetical protein